MPRDPTAIRQATLEKCLLSNGSKSTTFEDIVLGAVRLEARGKVIVARSLRVEPVLEPRPPAIVCPVRFGFEGSPWALSKIRKNIRSIVVCDLAFCRPS
jgi:hypothetical protein